MEMKAIFKSIGESLAHGAKVFLVYIVPAVLVALLTSEELRDTITGRPELALYAPVINFLFIVLAEQIKKYSSSENVIQKIL